MSTRPVVVASLGADGGDRCVDVIRGSDGWAWVACRRDPEDAQGWRHLHPARGGFATQAAAQADARDAVGRLADAAGTAGTARGGA